ncbi:hypothetical protein EHF33_15840 [Deinococcus psychrotolerans]|uniref:Uncharacterized protein n=1 Tax=Deinococcus psychrotolerans TaxID=2489213 RepID=A0A3G8YH88_9DEIO|nr:hypothetical protein [Deinococcus psychrotolerans]AZI44353.1 hypothetical protein EHF33_15840 [Deinococcus psychrotolerans]
MDSDICLKHNGEWGSITDIKDQRVSILKDDGSIPALSPWNVTKGNDFQVSQDDAQFAEAAAFSTPILSIAQNASVYVLGMCWTPDGSIRCLKTPRSP